jgi:hypothetical protein
VAVAVVCVLVAAGLVARRGRGPVTILSLPDLELMAPVLPDMPTLAALSPDEQYAREIAAVSHDAGSAMGFFFESVVPELREL